MCEIEDGSVPLSRPAVSISCTVALSRPRINFRNDTADASPALAGCISTWAHDSMAAYLTVHNAAVAITIWTCTTQNRSATLSDGSHECFVHSGSGQDEIIAWFSASSQYEPASKL
jgi:hypothetical protein